jgi:hypothetical protein
MTKKPMILMVVFLLYQTARKKLQMISVCVRNLKFQATARDHGMIEGGLRDKSRKRKLLPGRKQKRKTMILKATRLMNLRLSNLTGTPQRVFQKVFLLITTRMIISPRIPLNELIYCRRNIVLHN